MAAVILLLLLEGAMLWHLVMGIRLPPADAAVRPRRESPPRIPAAPVGARSMVFNFRVSKSVIDDCRRTPMYNCQRLDNILAKMAAQPRDLTWAPDTESRLARVLVDDARGVHIRALECRSTLCAAELASDTDYPRVSLASDDALDRELRWDGATTTAWEDDARTGRRTIVTAVTWEMRESRRQDPSRAAMTR